MVNIPFKELLDDRLRRRGVIQQHDLLTVIKDYLSLSLIKVFLLTPITANQVSFLSIFSLIIAAILFGTGIKNLLLLGIFFVYLGELFDHTDGSIARFKKQTTILQSEFLGRFYHICGIAFIHFGLSYGVAKQTGNIIYLYLGFSSSFFHILTMYLGQLKNSLILQFVKDTGQDKNKDAGKDTKSYETTFWKRKTSKVLSFVHHIFFDYVREILFIGILSSLFITSAVLKGIILLYALLIFAKFFFVFSFFFLEFKKLEKYAVKKKKLL